uniref:Uncharacterized protein n=1 Tax=Rhabditophanes sp. KR3021 TaxID=114890 RepID=A0AC35U2D2_9BILA
MKLDIDNRTRLNNSENILPSQDCLTENCTALLPLIQNSFITISPFKITDSCSKKTYSMGSGLKFSKDGTTGSLIKVNVAVNPSVDNIGNTKIKTTEKLGTNPFKKAATIDSEVGNYENHFEKKSIFA